jgi:hypothetical protein
VVADVCVVEGDSADISELEATVLSILMLVDSPPEIMEDGTVTNDFTSCATVLDAC